MKEASVGGGVGVGVSVAGGAGVSVEVGRGVAVMNAWQVGHTAFGRVAEAVGARPAEHDAIRIENGLADVCAETCVACGICVAVCPRRALKMGRTEARVR